MTLRDLICARIHQDGPISVADYMSDCLLHPTLGYYTTRDPFGVAGDFITAPEISQMFGEVIGLCLAQVWIDQGRPARFTLAELGPGRGTLMADILRATRAVAGFSAAAEITLIEASPSLRAAQRETLAPFAPGWLAGIDDLPEQPLLLVANEFFDALPIRQFIRRGEGWCERRIGIGDEGLAFGLTDPAAFPALNHRLADTSEGDLVEICAAATPFIGAISSRIAHHGGAALILDYGDWRSLGDTLQALQDHHPVDALSDPGRADLTAHVDFESLSQAASQAGCAHTRLTPQGVFLERLGLTARAQSLAKGQGSAIQNQLASAHRRLTHPDEMGNLFKTLGLYPAHANPPPGLNP